MIKSKNPKPNIGVFGRRSVGKSSLLNALAGHDIFSVGEIVVASAEPVKKQAEVPLIGQVILTDTPAIPVVDADYERIISETMDVLKSVDLGILVISDNLFAAPEKKIANALLGLHTPFIVVHNKSDVTEISPAMKNIIEKAYGTVVMDFCALSRSTTGTVISAIKKYLPDTSELTASSLTGLVTRGDIILLLIPDDMQLIASRILSPEFVVARDALEAGASVTFVRSSELAELAATITPKPRLLICDSINHPSISEQLKGSVPLTTFSLLIARQKGDLDLYIQGAEKIKELKDGDNILVVESCSYHSFCEGVCRDFLPDMISKFTSSNLNFESFSSTGALPRDLKKLSLIIQCGDCPLTRRQILIRIKSAVDAGVPVTNYGVAMASIQGLLDQSVLLFKGSKANS